MLYVPEGFAHGYQTLDDDAEMYYMTTACCTRPPRRGACATTIRRFGIGWPLPVTVISDADRKWPDFKSTSLRRARLTSDVLLTGASGFIGHHCLEPLRARGYEVHAVSSRRAS